MLKEIKMKVVSYCDIPEQIAQEDSRLSEAGPDCYIDHEITMLSERAKYDDDWELDDWLLKEYPELKEGEKILINVDY